LAIANLVKQEQSVMFFGDSAGTRGAALSVEKLMTIVETGCHLLIAGALPLPQKYIAPAAFVPSRCPNSRLALGIRHVCI
jgi:hypothetical protein